jgi:diguanylate cyclase (GGDEF)-like protein
LSLRWPGWLRSRSGWTSSWELDELVVVFFFAGVAAIGLLLLRGIELRKEIVIRERAERRANALARHDALTGLPNRRMFRDELDAALASDGVRGAVFLIDIDRFKSVNDVYGHGVGDDLLVEIAKRLKAAAGPCNLISRIGGDEFACVIRSHAGAQELAGLAERLVKILDEDIEAGPAAVRAGATIGIATFPENGTTSSELLRSADIALYQGKRGGRATYRFFDAEFDNVLVERTILGSELGAALESHQIRPFFQPIVRLSTREIVGFEALARWAHPVRGAVGPDIFIPIAEETGLINALTEKVLEQACRAALDWPAEIDLSINIAPVQLKDPWFAARILKAMNCVGFPPTRLIMEVTESTVVEEVEAVAANLSSLQNSGVRIALDDFGRGYSSLSYLHRLKFDVIKVDRSFVMGLDHPENEKIVAAVAGLGKALGMPVTAEGIETEATVQSLRRLGFEYGQGHLFGRPVPACETEQLLAPDAPRTMLRRAG